MLFLGSGCVSTKGFMAVPAGSMAAVAEGTERAAAVSAKEDRGLDISPLQDPPQQAAPQVEELAPPMFRPPARPIVEREPIEPERVVNVEGSVMLNAEAMPLSDFIIYALGETLKVTFFIDEHVKNMKNPITLRMTQEMPAGRVFEIVLRLFEEHALFIEEEGGALYITSLDHRARRPVDIRIGRDVPDTPAEVLQIVPLKHIRFHDIGTIIRELYGGVNIKQYPGENILLLSGPGTQVRGVVEFIEQFDVPHIRDKKLFMLTLIYWQTDEFIKQLSKILEGVGFSIARRPGDAGIFFIPIKFLNSILVVAPDDETVRYVIDWHRRLDTVEAAGAEKKAFTYTPLYSKASDLVDTLKRLHTGLPALAEGGGTSKAKAHAPAVIAPGLKISSDDRTNIVLIYASPAEYRRVRSFLKKLDVPTRQVLIEATVAELTLRDDLRYGLEWYIKNRMANGDYVLRTLGQLGLSVGTGLGYQFISDTQKFRALINVFAQQDRINILSRPRLMVIDNEEATIQIGQDIPIITAEVIDDDVEAASIVREIQYRTTGVILRIRPTINTGGLLTLRIHQEVSEAQINVVSGIDSPIILIRRLTTKVVAAHGQTIILGGLMSETASETVTKVPLLGDIPILGHLFRTTSVADVETELIILITPTILTTTDEAVRVTDEIKQGLEWLR